MKKRMVCLLLCIVFFLAGGLSGYFLRGIGSQPYRFYNFEDMNKAGMGIHFRDPEVPLPLEARWVAGVQFHQEEKEVTVYIRSGSGVPVTSEFVLSRVQNTDGYRIRAVCESLYTYQEAYQQIAALDAFFEAYAPDEIRGQEPWLVCEVRADEQNGICVHAALNDPVWGQSGYTQEAKEDLVGCVNRVCRGTYAAGEGVVWEDFIEPYGAWGHNGYTQYPVL